MSTTVVVLARIGWVENAGGDKFPIYDTGANADMWPTMSYRPGDTQLVIEATSDQAFGNEMFIYNTLGDNSIQLNVSTDASNIDLFVDAAPADPTETIVQGSGGDIDITGPQLAGNNNNPFGNLFTKLYYKEGEASGAELLHDSAQLPKDVKVQLPFGNGEITVTYNANASTEGKEIRYSAGNSRFEADLSGDLTFGLGGFRPYQAVIN